MTSAQTPPVNEVRLAGKVSGEPTERELPSGDLLVQFRLVVPRTQRKNGPDAVSRASVDTIDIACWTARTRAFAVRFTDGLQVEVRGALRRRFFATGAGRASRYEVEAVRSGGVDGPVDSG